ncbi:unnamed protein product, partial [Hymenolepis diminuta]
SSGCIRVNRKRYSAHPDGVDSKHTDNGRGHTKGNSERCDPTTSFKVYPVHVTFISTKVDLLESCRRRDQKQFILAILEQVGWKSHPEETFTGWAWTRTPNISCANATNASKLQDHDSPRSSVMATNGQKKYHQP